ncbi:MAG: putative LPS assembly protein LptD [Flavobacteriales bacterium]|nr:putative LPS assembly protein LptD [Flavobacteriales bacterium]
MLISYSNLSYSQTSPDTVQSELESPLFYDAEDSIDLDMVNQKAYLYNQAHIKYGSFELKACFIAFDFKTQQVTARLCRDSLGKKIGVPELTDGDVKTKADSLGFNFETKRGITYQVKMQEGEGYIHGNKVKRQSSGDIHIDTALYTTCDLDHPHYYFKLRKAIIKPDDKIISGPVNLFIADIPTPLGLPFAYFPNQKYGTNGIIIPTYGNSPDRGFYLTGGGYYYKFQKKKNGKFSPLADKLALMLTGDIYSKGSWGTSFNAEYKNKYKYNGNLNIRFLQVVNGEKGFDSFSKSNQLFVRWTHYQDPKSIPNSTFNGTVNIGSQRQLINDYNNITAQNALTNTFNSNIAWGRSFKGKINSNLNLNLSHDQNSLNNTINFRLPEASYNMNRFFIGKLFTKTHTGSDYWYEQIGTTYSVNFKNRTYASMDENGNFSTTDLINNIEYGAKHNIKAATSIRMFNKKVSLTPNYNFNLYNYFEQTQKRYDAINDSIITDTIETFGMPFTQSFSAGLTTKIYGFYKFADFIRGKKESVVRHSITPSINASYRPNSSYEYQYQSDSNGTLNSANLYQTGIYGTPVSGESGRIGFSLINALELKQKDLEDDSTKTPYKKTSILDNLTLTSGYDFLKDSMNLDVIRFTGRTKLYKNLNTRFSAILDPYAYDAEGNRTKVFQTNINGDLGTFTNADFALNLSFKSKTSKKGDYRSSAGSQAELDQINNNKEQYLDFNIPWIISLDYKINYRKLFNDEDPFQLIQTIGVNGQLKITENWMIDYLTNYDITNKQFSFSSIDIRRDLHCWEMAFHWVPFGNLQSYSIQINVKSAMLQDLKLQRRRNWYDNGIN